MASVTVFKNGEKNEILVRQINFLLTGLRIYTGESKACGPHNALPSVGHYVEPWARALYRISWAVSDLQTGY